MHEAPQTLAIRGGSPACPFEWPSWPIWDEKDERSVLETLRSGEWWYGEKVQRFEREYANFQGAKHCVSCTNGTTALEMGLRALGITAGDEVIVPAYSFIATASAVVTVGAVPIFCDICPDTLCIDPQDVAAKLSSRTRAIIPVHVAGRMADMPSLLELARKHDLRVLEDAAHAWGSQENGKGAGTFGQAGTFSFQVTKNLTAGEGGALVTDDPDLAELCRSFSHCGRQTGGAWYDHENLGSNLRMTEFQAALLLTQLQRLPAQVALRDRNAQQIEAVLRTQPAVTVLASSGGMNRRSHHFYPFRLNSSDGRCTRRQVIQALEAEGIPVTAGWYQPLYCNGLFTKAHVGPVHGIRSPLAGMNVDYTRVQCSVTEQVCRDTIWIPQHVLLADEAKIASLCHGLRKVFSNLHQLEH